MQISFIRLSFLFGILFCAFNLQAEAVGSALEQIDNYIGSPAFNNSFRSGDQMTTQFVEDLRGIKDKATTFGEVSVSNDVAMVTHRRADGSAGSKSQFLIKDWQRWNGNYVRSVIEFIESYGYKIELQIIGETTLPVTVNGVLTQIKALKVAYTGSHSFGSKVTGEFIVTNELPGPAQLLYRHELVTGIDRQWTLTEFQSRSHDSQL